MGRIGWPWVIICFGIVLRLSQYWFNRSLWLDEALLALNITSRSIADLLKPLDHGQGGPVGFLIVERLGVQVLGDSEYVLRLFPFLCGIVSLLLFYRVARWFIEPQAVPIAVALFAISEPLIYYSSELKQYSSDVTVALVLYWVTIYTRSKTLSVAPIALFGALGAAAIWFSHPSVFVLGGIAGTEALLCVKRKNWERVGRLSIVYSVWALSLGACYFVSLQSLISNQALVNYWRAGFMPFPPVSLSDVKWFVDSFFQIFKDPVGLPLSGIAALAFLVGSGSALAGKKEKALLLLSPVLLVLFASGLHKYPFRGRLLLFLVPAVLLLIAEGAWQIKDKTSYRYALIGPTLVGLLFLHPLLSATYHLIKPRTREEIRPAIYYIAQRRQNGDLLYLYYGAPRPFQYYSKRYGFNFPDYILGRSSRQNWGNYKEELNLLRGRERVWVLFSHIYKKNGVDEEKFFLDYLDSLGKRLDSFKSHGAGVYLYDLSGAG